MSERRELHLRDYRERERMVDTLAEFTGVHVDDARRFLEAITKVEPVYLVTEKMIERGAVFLYTHEFPGAEWVGKGPGADQMRAKAHGLLLAALRDEGR